MLLCLDFSPEIVENQGDTTPPGNDDSVQPNAPGKGGMPINNPLISGSGTNPDYLNPGLAEEATHPSLPPIFGEDERGPNAESNPESTPLVPGVYSTTCDAGKSPLLHHLYHGGCHSDLFLLGIHHNCVIGYFCIHAALPPLCVVYALFINTLYHLCRNMLILRTSTNCICVYFKMGYLRMFENKSNLRKLDVCFSIHLALMKIVCYSVP